MLRHHALEVAICVDLSRAMPMLRSAGTEYEVVIVNVSDARLPWPKTLAKLQEACFLSGGYPSPLFLCTSTTSRSPEFELQIERMGARYVLER